MSAKIKVKMQECPVSEDSLSISYCNSANFRATKKSRISSSFIRTSSSTMISNSSIHKIRSEDNFNECTEASENSSVNEISSSCKSLQVAVSKKILSFSIYSSSFPYASEGMLLLRENLEADLEETLLTTTQRFIELINNKIVDSKIHFIKPCHQTSEQSLYILKPMKKKSGKPDMDLPGFDLGKKVGEVNFDAFSVVFSPSCIRKLDDAEKGNNGLSQVIQSKKSFKKGRNEINERSSGCCQGCVIY